MGKSRIEQEVSKLSSLLKIKMLFFFLHSLEDAAAGTQERIFKYHPTLNTSR